MAFAKEERRIKICLGENHPPERDLLNERKKQHLQMFVFGCILVSVIKKKKGKSATGLWELVLKPRIAVEEK